MWGVVLGWVRRQRLVVTLVWVAMALLSGLLYWFHRDGYRKGQSQERQDAQEADHDRASDIRDSVDRIKPEWVRRFKDDGFRD